MNNSTIIGLVDNAALLLALGILYDMMGYRPRGKKPTLQQVTTGVILGAIGIAVMLNPWQFMPGVVFDTRSVLLSVSGLFFGVLPTLLVILMTSAFRLYNGGVGVWTGVAVIVTSGAIGLAWRHLRRRELEDMSIVELYAMGLVVHLVMLLWMFTLPWPLPISVLSKISLPVMVIFPVGTALLGRLMVNQGAHKRAEELLRESEGRYRTLFEHANDGIHLANGRDEIIDANPRMCEMMGYSHEEYLSMRVSDLQAPEVRWPAGDVIRGEVTRHGNTVFEALNVHRDGTRIPIEVSVSKVTGVEDELFVSVVRDITERKRAEEEIKAYSERLEEMVEERTAGLEIAIKEQEAFSYSISHDLRAPLRGIDGWSHALLEEYGDQLDEQAHEYIRRVRSQAQNMGQLIDDLLTLSRLSRHQLRRKPVDLTAMVQTIAAHLQEEQPQRPVEFVIQEGVTAQCDADLLEIVLGNLLDNAFKFTGSHSPVRIEFGQIEIEGQPAYFVRDNGAGFDMAYTQKLFEAFQRLHSPAEFPGTGIGLTIVQRVIHRHGGRVWAEAAVDQGATFTFTLTGTSSQTSSEAAPETDEPNEIEDAHQR